MDLRFEDNQQLADRYDRWATQYDADHDGWEWIGPAKAVEQLRDLGDSTVLDAGWHRPSRCRTCRHRLGRHARWLTCRPGCSPSPPRRPYERLVQASLTELPLEDGSVDAVIATGVFTHGHVGPEAFPEVLRVVRPGGWVVITCRSEVWAELEPAAADHEAAGRWSLHKRTAPESFHPGKDIEDNFPQSVVTWRVC